MCQLPSHHLMPLIPYHWQDKAWFSHLVGWQPSSEHQPEETVHWVDWPSYSATLKYFVQRTLSPPVSVERRLSSLRESFLKRQTWSEALKRFGKQVEGNCHWIYPWHPQRFRLHTSPCLSSEELWFCMTNPYIGTDPQQVLHCHSSLHFHCHVRPDYQFTVVTVQ